MTIKNPFLGTWTYRSLLNNPDASVAFNDLQFAVATVVLTEPSPATVGGALSWPGASLELHGSYGFGSPMQLRCQGKGMVGHDLYVYDYLAWLVPVWPNSTRHMQHPAIVGSVTRTQPHSSGDGKTAPAGVVASFYAVMQA